MAVVSTWMEVRPRTQCGRTLYARVTRVTRRVHFRFKRKQNTNMAARGTDGAVQSRVRDKWDDASRFKT